MRPFVGPVPEFGARREGFTPPEDAERFVSETGVDCLAIAIGTAHGVYEGDPEIDLELLDEISRRVAVPLALHGGTGGSDGQFRSAITRGIAKVNYVTGLLLGTASALRELARTGEPGYFDFGKASVESFRSLCAQQLRVFGASGKAL